MINDFNQQIHNVYNFLGLPVSSEFVSEIENRFYRIDNPEFLKENESRGYGFFRKGGVGEWQEKFSLLHKLFYSLFFKKRINAIKKRVDALTEKNNI